MTVNQRRKRARGETYAGRKKVLFNAWFGLTWSLDLYEQMNARIRRQGWE